MAGNVAGGKKAAQANMERYGADFYAKIGSIGGKRGRTGGFYVNRELASKMGKLGGKLSRKPKKEV